MPDIKTALHAVLNEWDKDEASLSKPSQPQAEPAKQRHYFQPTVGVSQISFNYVRDNPYTTAVQAVKALEQQGFKKSSLTSLYAQMVRQGHLSKDKDGKLTALIPEYQPLKATATLRNLGVLMRKKLTKMAKNAPIKADPPPLRPTKLNIDIRAIKQQNGVQAGIATLTQPMMQQVQQVQPLTAKQVLETLSIKEAHMLYRELQTMFGD